jgi:hypothetical protein
VTILVVHFSVVTSISEAKAPEGGNKGVCRILRQLAGKRAQRNGPVFRVAVDEQGWLSNSANVNDNRLTAL